VSEVSSFASSRGKVAFDTTFGQDGAMNKIVLEHYPVSKLPEELRQGFEASATVKVVVEEENRTDASPFTYPGFAKFSDKQPPAMTIEEALENVRRSRESDRPSVTTEEAVARIRMLRDEWDDE
jgi:hypothetical protein